MKYKITSSGTWTDIAAGNTVTLQQPDGIRIYLEATPSNGYYFVKYTNLAGTSNHSFDYYWSFYVSQDCEHMANYTTSSYLIKASASPNYGTISLGGCCAPTTVTSSGVRVGAGSTCTLSYSGASDYYVETWTEGSNELSNDLTCTLEKVSAAHTIVANTSNTRILTRTATTGGSVSGSSGPIAEGTSCTVTATANSGYVFLYWTWRGKVVSIEPSYTFKMPRRNYVLKAHFFSNNASAVNGYYYFDLAAGPVYLTSHSFVGYRYDGTTTPKAVAGTHSGSNKYYVYQSQKGYPSETGYYSTTGLSGSTITLPNYPQVKWDGKTWEEYVTNNTEVDDVTANWPTAAAASYRTVEEENNITITGNAIFDVTLDNIWTTKFGLGDGSGDVHEIGGITITSFLKTCYNNNSWGYQSEFTFYYNCKTTVKLKNTSKMTRIHYNRDHGTVADNYQGYLKFDSFTEAGSDEGSLTLTFPPRPPQEELVNDFDQTVGNSSLIGAGSFSNNGSDEWGQRGRQVTGVYFNGGTLYAGQRKVNFSRWNGPGSNIVACIGGLNSWGEFYINGGKLTAVANTNSAAIGGGGGYGGGYGSAKISITGGKVYAYNFGVFNTTYNATPLNLLLPGTAIGGGSSVCTNDEDFSKCGNAEISITGGTVYAKSIGGVAIGGGSSALRAGGNADITINGGTVTAISEAGTIGGETIGAGSGLGGGIGGVGANHSGVFTHYPGGDADIHIIDGTVNGSSVGGGSSLDNVVGDGGSANVIVEGGTITLDGRIGGGSSMGSGAGGNAAIYVTGGTLDCGAIGGGDSKTGTPGMVLSAVSGRAGVHIEGDNKITVKAGYIGGGRQTDGDGLGKATAYIDARHAESTIQGQFILRDVSGSKSGDHCYFTMLSGTIDNTDLGTGKYVMARPEGAAVYIDDPAGEVSISGGIIQNSTATKGGAIYANGGTTSITGGILQNNHATSDGGAIYANGGTVTVNYPSEDAGIIQNNYADEKGGALYISSTGRLNLYGNTTLKGNHVPFGKYGGGVYLEGIVQAGNGASDVIKVAENYADEAGAAINDANRNNIYLPNPTVNSDHKDVITVINNGLNLDNSSVGFSVRDNYVPVIYCATSSYLESTLMESDAIFEDSHSYQKYYTNGDDSYNANYIYLAADTWVDAQTSQPSPGFSVSGSNVTISNAQGLAWLCSYVNNFNGVTGDNTTINVTLNADVDMSGHSWVPIGINGKEFKGTFNGNGHTITGIHCTYIKGSAGTGTALGLFGTVNNATIHDVFVNDAEILVRDQTTGTYSMGTIANEAKGTTTIYNCSTNAYMESTLPGTTMGGLVGTLTGGEIHSSWSTAQMRGGTMGGMVGTVASGANLKNSFANVKFDYQGSTQYVGGLVSTNTGGTVENCYVREQAGSSHGSGFGWCVGDNSGTIAYCYIPQGETAYKANGTAQGNTCTTYGPTATPYSYRHTDNQMAENASNAKIVNGSFDRDGNPRGLLSTLNKWVSDNSGQGYATWMRTMGSPINGDYPIFHRTDAVCVGSEDNVALEYSADFNGKFSDYIKANTGTIYLYSTPARLVVDNATQDYNVDETNIGKNVELHIGKGVSLVPNSGKAITNANVNVWLDNSAGTNGASPVGHTDAIDWHFFSSVLTAAPIGLNYQNESQFDYGVTPPQAQFTNADGYFPLNLNSYYSEWDLYAYSEPEYHWINLKRNSQSHWHEDFDHGHINYTNETEFTPGKGYMVALDEEGYLQAYGTLNTHTSANPLEVDLDYTPGISWTTRQGHNLLGNPYQSYLDFNKFAEYNSGLWENSDFTNAGYVIMDEDQKDYIYYHYDASANTYTAPRYLHPHQGFMVIVNKLNLTAKFDDRMRNVDATGVTFRDGQPRYPLVNLFATDDNGNRDMVTVELGRPDKGGALKQGALRTSTGSLCCHYEGEDYALVFTQPGLESANIRFSTDADAAYTMTWDTQNGEFGYLHLVDNLTGADIDCLTASEYKFTSRTSDYASRFKLVFEYTGIEEQEDAEYTDGPTAFAYYANGEIHLTGTPDARARLQIIDMTGRVIVSRDAVPASATLSTNGMAAGVYVLRLTTANGTRTQKIILN